MALGPGEQILHYRIVEKIGEGGMGVVWKALDTTLDREVAIKVLPEAFAGDPDRLARFEREAKLLASLNHPNIATIHGLHRDRGMHFLAMELIDGEDLARRLAGGRVPVTEALQLAQRVVAALQAAHDSGVVHRDLKPANVRISPDGKVKVLDFGLAKVFEASAASGSDPSVSPTLTSAGTVAGVILGTAAYMSPEQARGQAVDRRADVWAFGVVLYEMLTGKPLFAGSSVSDTMAAVLRAEPDWDSLPRDTPRAVRRLLRRCLEKDPDRRLRDIADARLEIDDALSGEPVPEVTERKTPGSRVLPWALAALFAVVAIVAVATTRPRDAATGPREPVHLGVTLPRASVLTPVNPGDVVVDISSDGRWVAFTALSGNNPRLFLRSLGAGEIVEVPDTLGASGPFFSTDAQWVGYFDGGKLYKVSVQGGSPIELAEAPTNRGASWGPDGTIVFAPAYTSGLLRIGEDGGTPEALTTPDPARNERTHRWPQFLPGGKAVLYTVGTLDKPGNYEDARVDVIDLESGESRTLIERASFARYAPSGHLVYSRQKTLFAVPLDVDRLEISGAPVSVLDGVAGDPTSGSVNYAISATGTLLYVPVPSGALERRLVWVDRDGRSEPLASNTAELFQYPRISPDGKRVTMSIGPGPGDGDAWVYDLGRDSLTRLTFDSSTIYPIWSHDGMRIIYGVTRGGEEGLAWKAADGSDTGERLVRDGGQYAAFPETVIPGSRTIVYSRAGAEGGSNLMSVAPGDTEPSPLLVGPSMLGGARFSPDGRFMVYVSDESGRQQVYVQPYPGPGGRWQISTDGGRGPLWSRDGREIFYINATSMMVVDVQTDGSFSHGTPRLLFDYEFERTVGPAADYDVSPDGKRFLMIEREDPASVPRRLELVLHFPFASGS